MITTIKNFTDHHGLTHEAPVFAIQQVSLNKYVNKNSRFDKETKDHTEDASESARVEYSAIYWPSQSHMEDGNEPLTFRNKNEDEFMSFESEEEQLPIVEQAETHFLNKVL